MSDQIRHQLKILYEPDRAETDQYSGDGYGIPALVDAGRDYTVLLDHHGVLHVLYTQQDELGRFGLVGRFICYTHEPKATTPRTSRTYQLLAATVVAQNSDPLALPSRIVRCLILYRITAPQPAFTGGGLEFVRPGSSSPVQATPASAVSPRPGLSRPPLTSTRPGFRLTLLDLPLDTAGSNPVALSAFPSQVRHELEIEHSPEAVQFSPDGRSYILVSCPTTHRLVSRDGQPFSGNPTVSPTTSAFPSRAQTIDPAPYIWTQSESDVTVTYQLPPTVTTSSQIQCKFTRLSVTLNPSDNATSTSPPFPILHQRAFFDRIVPDESFWTLERGGLLTFYLQKVHEKTRWPCVYHDQVASGEHISETLDPSEYRTILERMKKYTVEGGGPDKDGDDHNRVSTGSIGTVRASTLDLDDDDTDDPAGSGRTLVATTIGEHGEVTVQFLFPHQAWLGRGFEPYTMAGRHSHLFNPTPNQVTPAPTLRICTHHDIDGLVYDLDWFIDKGPRIHHTGTFPAFGYVQASKRDRKLIRFDATSPGSKVSSPPAFVVLAEVNRYLYVYHRPDGPTVHQARQVIIDLASVAITEMTSDESPPTGGGRAKRLPFLDILGLQQVGATTLAVLLPNQLCLVEVN
ncbi:hypothetical protein IWQ60_006306 [Tieghemiomyces parasiticus]|uniref:NudC domain-containing protein 1 n=1 Tax=Tieghemiomyces parasiticus TaxID=78921 RepID=A0A9W8DXG3_9FUNG|nr:hypothetical protein IWQ60_006306 [Tieghemiomyces parasiticus]